MNLTFVLILHGCVQLAAGACAPGWVQFQTSCYKIEAAAKKTWTNAKKACEAEHSHLAIIMDTEENQFVKKELMKLHITDVLMCFWMDGTDINTEGTWVWETTGESFEIYDWSPGEPNQTGATKIAYHFSGCITFSGMTWAVINQKDMCVKGRWQADRSLVKTLRNGKLSIIIICIIV